MSRISTTVFVSTSEGWRNAVEHKEETIEKSLPLVLCPYCNTPAKLLDARKVWKSGQGYLWKCLQPNCDAHVGTHRNSYKPLGTLARADLREARIKAHRVFDYLWKSDRMNRKQAYLLLQERFGLTKSEAHIAKFNLEQCKKLISEFSRPEVIYGNSTATRAYA